MKAIAASPRKKTDLANRHPTSKRLINSTIELLQEFLPEEISTDLVLQHSGVSRGSLYYHFEDLSDLLETAMGGPDQGRANRAGGRCAD